NNTPVTVSTRNRKNVTPPMHQVYDRAMPCFLIDTGCKCRKKLVSITTMRLRRSWGIGCRKMLFHTCDSRMISPSDMFAYRAFEIEGRVPEWCPPCDGECD